MAKTKKSNTIEFHSVANIFPMMTGKEFEALKQDILTNGLKEPIWLYEGKIIDGRNRYLACLETGTKPIFREYNGNESDLIDFVISLNIYRRHLNTSQKACLAVDIMPVLEQRTKENLSKKMSAIRKGETEVSAKLQNLNSSQAASKIFGVSERYIFDAKKLHKESELLFGDVKAGKLTLQQAKKQLNLNGVSAKLQKPEIVETIELTRNDLKKVQELVMELGITEQKAKDYIAKQKSKRKPKQEQKQQTDYKEIKARIPQDMKDKIQSKAKQQGKSISELLRELLITSLD
jgi:predicted HicB family RNase H-like nuclease